MSKEIFPGFVNQVQPPELPVFLAKIEPLTVIKNEPPESDVEIIPDIKDVDLVSYILPEDLLKSETVPETTFGTKHIESMETQIFVKTENASFVKIENITESEILNKPEDTGNKGINKAKDQGVVEVQSKTYDRNLRYHCDNCAYKTCRSDDLKRHKIIHLKEEKIQYFYCHHCSHKTKRKDNLIAHISRHFRKGNVYNCDYCCYKTYKINHLKRHKIIHLKPGEIQYFYCYHCSHKAKHKADLKIHISRHFEKGNVPFHCYICNFVTLRRDFIITHIKKHAKFKLHEISCEKDTNMCDHKLKLHCDNCTYKTYRPDHFKAKIIHLKPEEIQYFYCHHSSHKFKRKDYLKVHLSVHFRNENVPFHCYICNFVKIKRDLITKHIRRHSKVQIKCDVFSFYYFLPMLINNWLCVGYP